MLWKDELKECLYDAFSIYMSYNNDNRKSFLLRRSSSNLMYYEIFYPIQNALILHAIFPELPMN